LLPEVNAPDLNDRLNLLAQEAKLEAIYLMDADGWVLATSNANEPHSFLGQNYGFRPYFQDALNGERSDYFAIGATSGRPGYFVAEPVLTKDGSRKGVIAIKLDVSELQRSWEVSTETVVAINKDNIVVLASNPDWLYRPISSFTPALQSAILDSRQFGSEPLTPLEWRRASGNRISVDGTTYLHASGSSEWQDWTVHYLQPDRIILRQTLLTTAFFGSVIAFLLGFATFLRSRRIEQAYTISERRRLDLSEANKRLEQAQSELATSSKLAALGHLAASVTHELGQPISAFRNHLVAAEMSNEITSVETSKNLNKLVDRMEATISQFRHFARGQTEQKSLTRLATVLEEAQNLLRAEIAAGRIALEPAQVGLDVKILAHQVQLEQAFTNLMKNAIHAVQNEVDPKIWITVKYQSSSVEIRVCDNGPGVGDATLTDLQEPFFSTKPSGVGMGLGLAIVTEIIKDHGGTLSVGTPPVGAEFIVTLPLVDDGENL
jgi:two-component system C4-dicarboxylate transport sensor histidine kinase DctB